MSSQTVAFEEADDADKQPSKTEASSDLRDHAKKSDVNDAGEKQLTEVGKHTKPTHLKQTTLKVVETSIVSSSVKLKEETSQEVTQMDCLKVKASFFPKLGTIRNVTDYERAVN